MQTTNSVRFVDLGKQYHIVRDEIIDLIDRISSSGQYVMGQELQQFEEQFAAYCGTKYAVGVGNGFDALFMSLKALGIGAGDEVITAPNSFIASAGAIAACGAKPTFADISEDLNIDPRKIESAITDRTKAIMPVHFTGRVADMESICEIADRHGLPIVEDAAQSVGALRNGTKAGAFGTVGCFSLHPLKTLHVNGDGGVLTTNDDHIYQQINKLRNHGLESRDNCTIWGYNSRLDNIQAGIANIKLKHLDNWIERCRAIAKRYSEELDGYVQVPKDDDFEKPIYHRYMILSDNRDELMRYLAENGVETKINYPIPIHLQSVGKENGFNTGDFPVAERLSNQILSLPLYPEMLDQDVDQVIDCIKKGPVAK